MYSKCNSSKYNGMSALTRFSAMFYLVVPEHFFIPLICPLDISPLIYKSTQMPYEVT